MLGAALQAGGAFSCPVGEKSAGQRGGHAVPQRRTVRILINRPSMLVLAEKARVFVVHVLAGRAGAVRYDVFLSVMLSLLSRSREGATYLCLWGVLYCMTYA